MDRRSWNYGGGGAGNFRDFGNNYRGDYNDYGGSYGGGYSSYNNSYVANSFSSFNNADHYPPPNRGYGGREGYGGFPPGGRFFPPAGPPRMGPIQPQRQPVRGGRVDWKKRRRDNNASRESKSAAFMERKKRTLFLRNCPEKPEETLKEELKALFADCGNVEQITINKQELNGTPGTDKKIALEIRIVMSTEDEAKKGLDKHGTIIEDRHLVVSRQESDFETWKTTVVCCLNISLDVDEEDLWRFFEHCGKIKNVKRVNATSGDGRLYGQVHFESEEEARKAIALDGRDLKGQAVKLRMWASLKDRPGLGVVVLNLPFGITRKDALEFMDGCGDISNLKIDAAETTNRRAIFVFWDADGVEKALQRDGVEMNKQRVRVLRWDGQRLINPVFLADLPAGILEVDLWKVFQVCGFLEHVHKEMKKNNMKAYIEFQEPQSVEKAVSLDGISIKGSVVKVLTDKDEWDNYPPPTTSSRPLAASHGAQNGQSDTQQDDAGIESKEEESVNAVKLEVTKEIDNEEPQETASAPEVKEEANSVAVEDIKVEPEKVAEVEEGGRTTRKRRAATVTQVKTPPKTRRGR